MAPRILIAMTRALRIKGARDHGNARMVGVAAKGTRNRTVRVSDEVWNPAKELAQHLGETIPEVVRESLLAYVELHNEPTWAEAMAVAKERGDDLPAIIIEALREYIAHNS